MPKKRTDGFHKLTVDQQQEVIERFKGRKEVRAANNQLATLVLNWITGGDLTEQQFMAQFEAGGHHGEYHQEPTQTTFDRVSIQISTLANITKRLNDTPLDYMGAVELSYVYQRIQSMIAVLESTAGGTMQQGIDIYHTIGEAIRQRVFNEMGYYPEEFPVPDGRITGNEAARQFKLTDHQPALM